MQDMCPDIQQPFSAMQAGGSQSVDTSHAYLGAGPMMGLEPLGYSEALSLFPPSSTMDTSGNGMPPFFTEGAGFQGNPDTPPDFAVLNDTLSFWTNGPTSSG